MRRRGHLVALAVAVAALVVALLGALVPPSGPPSPAPSQPVDPVAALVAPTESQFVPVTPCRIVNTQNPAGRIAAGETRAYRTQGDTASQGGASTCGVPSTATAIEVSVTAVSALGSGYLRLWPGDRPRPNATFLSFTKGVNVTNTGAVAVAAGTSANLVVKGYLSATHVVIDVLGYYVPELYAVVGTGGALAGGSGVTSVVRVSLGVYEVTFDRLVTGCAYAVTLGADHRGDGAASNTGPVTSVTVRLYAAFTNVNIDVPFHLTVDC